MDLETIGVRSMSETAVQTKEPTPVAWNDTGVRLQSIDDAYRFAKYVVASGMAPGLKDEVSVVVALQTGMELGFSPMRSLQVVNVIKGRPSLAVEAMGAKVESDGVLEPGTKLRFRYLKNGDDIGCQAYSTPLGGKPIEDEPVWLSDFKHLSSNDNWKKYPKRMLKARAVGWHIRDNYAASVNNLPAADEVRDIASARGHSPVERDITPPAKHHPLLTSASGGDEESEAGHGPEVGELQDPIDPEDPMGPVDAEMLPPDGRCCLLFEGWGRLEGDDAETCIHCGSVKPGGEG